MAEQKDIYYDGRIYQQVPDGMSRYNYGSVHVDGKHSFVNMQAIIEGKDYETGIKPYSSTTVAYDMTWMNKERICPSCKNNQTSPDHNCDICNGIGYYTPPDELDKEAKELVFSNDDLDRNGNVKLIKFLLGRIDTLKPKNKSQEVAIEAIKSMIIETDYFGNGKSLIHIENENAGSLEYALNKFHAINELNKPTT